MSVLHPRSTRKTQCGTAILAGITLFGVSSLAQTSDAVKAPMPTLESPKARYTFSDQNLLPDSKILWDGFLTGLRGFGHFYEPVGQPLYFETPFNTTSARFLFLHHEFNDDSQLKGGEVNVAALQLRVALTERLGFIATKDGYSWLNTGALKDDDGWNQVAAGLKYAVYVDREADLVVTPGFRFQTQGGESKVLQNTVGEVSPFVSVAKGWDKFHLIGNFTYRLPTDSKGNNIIQWDVHADYEVLPGFAPLLELHGLHYVSDGDRLGLSVGGLDYTNLGSKDVSGSTVIWAGAGARWKLTPNVSTGATYEVGLTNHRADIMDQRLTFDVILSW